MAAHKVYFGMLVSDAQVDRFCPPRKVSVGDEARFQVIGTCEALDDSEGWVGRVRVTNINTTNHIISAILTLGEDGKGVCVEMSAEEFSYLKAVEEAHMPASTRTEIYRLRSPAPPTSSATATS